LKWVDNNKAEAAEHHAMLGIQQLTATANLGISIRIS
jgi:hypothetical protein